MSNLASLYLFMGRFKDAKLLLQQVLEINIMTIGPNHPKITLQLTHIAAVYEAEGHYTRARRYLSGCSAGHKCVPASLQGTSSKRTFTGLLILMKLMGLTLNLVIIDGEPSLQLEVVLVRNPRLR